MEAPVVVFEHIFHMSKQIFSSVVDCSIPRDEGSNPVRPTRHLLRQSCSLWRMEHYRRDTSCSTSENLQYTLQTYYAIFSVEYYLSLPPKVQGETDLDYDISYGCTQKTYYYECLARQEKKEPESRTLAVGEIKCKSLGHGWGNNQKCIFLKSFQHGMFFRTTFRLVEISHLSKSTCREYLERGRKDGWLHSMDGARLGYLCLVVKEGSRVDLLTLFEPPRNPRK